MGRPALDLTGERFGKLTVVRRLPNSEKNAVVWECLCDCGNRVAVPTNLLRTGHKTSCNCYRQDRMRSLNLIHGGSHDRLYEIHRKMIRRCTNANDVNFRHYGGRGINVCDEWRDYGVFRNWALVNGYNDNLSLDRIDVNGDYCPGNCRWATAKEQSNNKRNNILLTLDGETHTMSEWCDLRGLKYKTVSRRYFTGKPVEQILSKESLRYGRNQSRAVCGNRTC